MTRGLWWDASKQTQDKTNDRRIIETLGRPERILQLFMNNRVLMTKDLDYNRVIKNHPDRIRFKNYTEWTNYRVFKLCHLIKKLFLDCNEVYAIVPRGHYYEWDRGLEYLLRQFAKDGYYMSIYCDEERQGNGFYILVQKFNDRFEKQFQ